MAGVIRCPSCAQANRVPDLGEGKAAVCGRCGTALPDRQTPLHASDANFHQIVGRGTPTVVDFWAAWCGPCRVIAPVIDELAGTRSDVVFAKLNIDENPATAAAFRVSSIPALLFFQDGVEKGRVVGAVPRGHIEQAIRQHFGL